MTNYTFVISNPLAATSDAIIILDYPFLNKLSLYNLFLCSISPCRTTLDVDKFLEI